MNFAIPFPTYLRITKRKNKWYLIYAIFIISLIVQLIFYRSAVSNQAVLASNAIHSTTKKVLKHTQLEFSKLKSPRDYVQQNLQSIRFQLPDSLASLNGKTYKEITLDNLESLDTENIDIINGNDHFKQFFSKFFDVLVENKQKIPHPNRLIFVNGKPIIPNVKTVDNPDDTLSEEELYSFEEFSDDFINDLTIKHANIVSSIPKKIPADFYKGDGYVIVGGGKYSWLAYLVIKTLRKVGSTLPVEVMLPEDSEYEHELCEEIFPNLNAKCIQMSTIFGDKNLEKLGKLSGYQYKSFALLASSFDNCFLLDSDAFPMTNPDKLFQSAVYNDYKMITWQDFWRRTTSPFYYQIAGIEVENKVIRYLNDFYTPPRNHIDKQKTSDYQNKVPFHDRLGALPDWSTESGEMLLKKSVYFDSLLLSLYYNSDGPQCYHPLLSQGGAGEGDKETFVAAAHFFRHTYYQSYKAPDKLFGYYKPEIGYSWEHSTIVQYDPVYDYEILKATINKIENSIIEKELNNEEFHYSYREMYRYPWKKSNVPVMFYHVHDPKIDPYKMVESEHALDREGNHIRNIGEEWPDVKFDLELFIWQTINESMCINKLNFESFKDQDPSSICDEFIHTRLAFLERTNKILLNDWKGFKQDE
ncbi:unnamed protein product [[Candida] boidinii]|uniref:Unnamed protein product n=1 Tax=Candida boidinii TaxID=5477 RepID=A0A9W6T0T0_CANBO|nr:transferase activity protein [[Candida] boidinii]OWB86964.1 transferase activity protein [[Candida] boidinii]GME72256.1 unnamed protein product [[Candida] boidinii]